MRRSAACWPPYARGWARRPRLPRTPPTRRPLRRRLPSKPSIAVLPFTDMTGSEGQGLFRRRHGCGDRRGALAHSGPIFVIASGSGLSFKGKGVSAQEAARELGSAMCSKAAFRKAGGRVRIGVQLIDAADGAQIWTNRFEDTLEDVLRAARTRWRSRWRARSKPAVQEAEVRHASARPTENTGSYDLYLRGMALSRSLDRTETFCRRLTC